MDRTALARFGILRNRANFHPSGRICFPHAFVVAYRWCWLIGRITREMAHGYKTSASCSLTIVNGGRPSTIRGEVVDVSVDGAQILCDKPISVGTAVLLTLDKITMPELSAKVVENHGDAGSGYRMDLRITRGSWPYQVFVTLTTFAVTPDKMDGTVTPPCLEELGLRFPCTADEVRVSFQRKVRLAHPDRGGDVESFVRLRAAYHEALTLLGAKR